MHTNVVTVLEVHLHLNLDNPLVGKKCVTPFDRVVSSKNKCLTEFRPEFRLFEHLQALEHSDVTHCVFKWNNQHKRKLEDLKSSDDSLYLAAL